MRLIMEFEYYKPPTDGEPKSIQINNPEFVAQKGDTIWYEFENGSGDIPFKVEDRVLRYTGNILTQITLFLKEQ